MRCQGNCYLEAKSLREESFSWKCPVGKLVIKLISLPTDVIELILFSEVIDYLSLTRLSLVCHRLHTITLSNKIWKLQGKRRWRVWSFCSGPSASLRIADVTDWKGLFVSRFFSEKVVFSFLNRISCDYLMVDKSNGLVDDNMIEDQLIEQPYLMENLRELLDDGDFNQNISHKFYAPSVYSYFKRKQLMLSFTSVFGKDLNSFCRTMEHISIWIDRWMNPVEDLEYFDYSHQFDSLADRARLKLPTAATERDIISAIDRVMFKEDGYRVSHNFYSHTNSYLHKVLRTKEGIYITLAVIFQAVASRLGLNLFPVSFPGCFSLWYQEFDESATQTQYLSFVNGNGVSRFSEREVESFNNRNQHDDSLSSVQTVATRMLFNISLNLIDKEPYGRVDERLSFIDSTELLIKLNPLLDRSLSKLLHNSYLNLNYNLNKSSLYTADKGKTSTDDTCVEVYRRTSTFYHDEEYPIGAIVRMNAGSYGVVCFWNHSACYGILADNDSSTRDYQYGELTLCRRHEVRPIRNTLIGKFFSHFNGLYYHPIPSMQRLFPDDESYIQGLLC